MNLAIKKIAVVGNSSCGKTTLSRKLSELHGLPVTHVDSIQFLPGMQIRPHAESIATLTQIQNHEAWIIDGYGPLDIIEKRFQAADKIVFIDFPLWRHLWWCSKRQVKNLWSRRQELPEGCDEASFQHSLKLYKNILKAHKLMRPELLRIFSRDSLRPKTVIIKSLKEWRQIFRHGIID